MRRLAIRPGGIGDVILSLPALEHLGAEVWTRSEMLPLIPGSRALSATGLDTILDTAPAGIFDAFDEVHSWYGTQRAEFRAAVEAIHPKVFWYEALPADSSSHAADFYAAQVGAPLPAWPLIEVAAQSNRLIWIHPFSGSARKNWSLDNFRRLAGYLEATGRSVQFIVAPHQLLPGARVVENLAELAGLLRGAAIYIGNDCGITHLAAAAGANTLAIFGPTDARVWAPRGNQVEVLLAPDLDALSAERVLDAALAKTGFPQDDA